MPSIFAANALRAGFTSAEWNAAATGSIVASRPALASACIAASMPACEPDTTVCAGALWLATTTPSMPAIACSTCSRPPRTAAIVPSFHGVLGARGVDG
ncbi:MAG: hypothetical protein U1F20_10285 [Lysobacterales bacterium]